MQLLVYAKPDDENGKRLVVAVHEALPLQPIELFKQWRSLHERLHSIVEPESIAIVLALDQAELVQMQVLRNLLTEIFVILVIPDNRKSTIRLAHLLLPRFMSQKEDSFSDLQEVLKKIVRTPH